MKKRIGLISVLVLLLVLVTVSAALSARVPSFPGTGIDVLSTLACYSANRPATLETL